MTDINTFTTEEDFILIKLVRMFGAKKWKNISVYISKIFPTRPKNQKVCKSRWFKNLNPKINQKCCWTIIEEFIFFEGQKILGNKWATISKLLPGRTDNNIKNHFYSTLRKNIRRYLKDKSNFSCVKDKMITFYTMMYVKEKFLELRKFYISESNTLDIKKEKRNLHSENANLDESYISELICKSGGSIEGIDKHLTTICLDLIQNNSEIDCFKFSQVTFDINNKQDVDVIYEVISKLVMKNAVNSYLEGSSSKENSEKNSRMESKDSKQKKLRKEKNSKIDKSSSYTSNSNDSDDCSMEERTPRQIKTKSGIKFTITPNCNSPTENILNNLNPSQNISHQTKSQIVSSAQKFSNNLNRPTCRVPIGEDKINLLINKFTKDFTYDTNIFENIKNSSYFNNSCDSNSSNNKISNLFTKTFEEVNCNSNLFEDSNSINKDKILFNLLERDKNSNSPFINNDLMEKLQEENNFGLLKSNLEKIIFNNILNSNGNNNESRNGSSSNQMGLNYDLENYGNTHSNLKNDGATGYLLNESHLQQLINNFEKLKKENSGSNSNSNLLQNKTYRSSQDI